LTNVPTVNAVVTVGHLTVMQKAKESTTAKEKATKEAKKQKVQKEKDPATITNQAEVHEALMKAVE